jgi:hypothetical protein
VPFVWIDPLTRLREDYASNPGRDSGFSRLSLGKHKDSNLKQATTSHTPLLIHILLVLIPYFIRPCMNSAVVAASENSLPSNNRKSLCDTEPQTRSCSTDKICNFWDDICIR